MDTTKDISQIKDIEVHENETSKSNAILDLCHNLTTNNRSEEALKTLNNILRHQIIVWNDIVKLKATILQSEEHHEEVILLLCAAIRNCRSTPLDMQKIFLSSISHVIHLEEDGKEVQGKRGSELLAWCGSKCLHLQKHQLALECLRAALAFDEDITSSMAIHIHFLLGKIFLSLHQDDEALKYFEKCYELLRESQDESYLAMVLIHLSTLYTQQQNWIHSIQCHEELLDLYDIWIEQSHCNSIESDIPPYFTKEFILNVRENLCISYAKCGDFSKAISVAEHAIREISCEEKENSQQQHLCSLLFLKGKYFYSSGDFAQALDAAKQHFKLVNEIVFSTSLNRTLSLMNANCLLGRIYSQLHDDKSSHRHHMKAIHLSDKTGSSSKQMKVLKRYLEDLIYLEQIEESRKIMENLEKNLHDHGKDLELVDRVKLLSWIAEIRAHFFHDLEKSEKSFQQILISLKSENSSNEATSKPSASPSIISHVNLTFSTVLSRSDSIVKWNAALDMLKVYLPQLECWIVDRLTCESMIKSKWWKLLSNSYRAYIKVMYHCGRKEDCIVATENASKWNWLGAFLKSSGASQSTDTMNLNHSDATLKMILSEYLSKSEFLLSMCEWNWNQISTGLNQLPNQPKILLYHCLEDDIYAAFLSTDDISQSVVRHVLIKNSRETVIQLLQTFYNRATQLRNFFVLCENRSLPLPFVDLNVTRRNSRKHLPVSSQTETKGTDSTFQMEEILSELHKILCSPFEDLFRSRSSTSSGKSTKTQLIVICNDFLQMCPFDYLTDKQNISLAERTDLMMLNSIFHLHVHRQHHLRHVVSMAEVQKHRQTLKQPTPYLVPHSESLQSIVCKPHINPRMVTNPISLRQSTSQAQHSEKVKCLLENSVVNGMSSLTMDTITGTAILTSPVDIPYFEQVADMDRCCLIGSPNVPSNLQVNRSTWKLGLKCLDKASKELRELSKLCGFEVVEGEKATKKVFLKEAPRATLLHIATWACQTRGWLLFAPEVPEGTLKNDLPRETSSFLVTERDILQGDFQAQLVILSCGWSSNPRKWNDFTTSMDQFECNLLTSFFLLAGAECVLSLRWPVSQVMLNTFYFTFYNRLRHGSYVSKAFHEAVESIKSLESCPPMSWCSFQLHGHDVYLDLTYVRHCEIDQTLNSIEESFIEQNGHNPWNVTRSTDKNADVKTRLQEWMVKLIRNYDISVDVCRKLVTLFCTTLEKQNNPSSYEEVIQLDQQLDTPLIREFLTFLGYFVAPRGSLPKEPYLTLPDKTFKFLCALDACRACEYLFLHDAIRMSLIDCLILTEDTLSKLIDLLAITKHCPDLQLSMNDRTIISLWKDDKLRCLLSGCGFKTLVHNFHFQNTMLNQKICSNLLQLFLSFSTSKNPRLFSQLDPSFLSQEYPLYSSSPIPCPLSPQPSRELSPGTNVSHSRMISKRLSVDQLPSLQLQRNTFGEIYRSRPWLILPESGKEVHLKNQLVASMMDIQQLKMDSVDVSQLWNDYSLYHQSKVAETEYYSQPPLGRRVKVHPGGSPAKSRVPLSRIPVLSITESDAKRKKYMEYLKQCRESAMKSADMKVRQLFLPHLHN